MRSYKLNRHIATIEGPVYGHSTHNGVKTTLFKAVIDGKPAYHAPSPDLVRSWLIRQGYRPQS